MNVTARRGAPRRDEPSARDRLIATATELFYQDGIRAIGIDTVLAKSGVAKSTLYRNFGSKDELIAAVAAEQDRRFWQWWDHIEQANARSPRMVVEALFIGIVELISRPTFRGCPFINVAIEFPDRTHPGTAVACANKQTVRQRLRELSTAMGARNPARLGDQLALLMDGAYGQAVTIGTSNLREDLLSAVAKLIDGESDHD
ncbi:TetR/AcrR family transcriptional regulator [Mesorhizobium kowhaii]|uniref:TetR family transcriptional regulator n=1 Tax=Mesorhizobium kowhaii TaxID=1300272 RepID=A0A2W7CAQ4_9HYPH|nr:TetR/AcrR family transcriptional regulator [Mesorhizobium kowhaii]PZV40117.1 TetR family transcriptional regulator [Mesorhizobium kowhaii]